MEGTVKFVQTTPGNDKIFRVLQYSVRYFIAKGLTCRQISSLEHHITLARKIARTTRDLEYFQKGLVAIGNPDRVEAVGRTVAAFGKCCWLLTDHIDLLYRIGVVSSRSGSPVSKWSKISNWLWLLGYLGSILLYLRQLSIVEDQILEAQRRFIGNGLVESINEEETDAQVAELDKLKELRSSIWVDVIREFLDCGIPAGSLGLMSMSSGSFTGILSSCVGAYQVNKSL
eukprot:sb/3469511/